MSSVNDAPAGDRLPFPQSAQRSPNSKRLAPTSGSIASLPPNGTLTPTQVITLDSLLSTHANDPSPPMAALHQLLGERNAFAAQNAQLWRLIEKQRSGYNQILKELERVRSERDVYRNRSNALVNADKDKKRDGEKQRRPSNTIRQGDPSGSSSYAKVEQCEQSLILDKQNEDSYSRLFQPHPGHIAKCIPATPKILISLHLVALLRLRLFPHSTTHQPLAWQPPQASLLQTTFP
jgi:hypothetical protein